MWKDPGTLEFPFSAGEEGDFRAAVRSSTDRRFGRESNFRGGGFPVLRRLVEEALVAAGHRRESFFETLWGLE